MRITNSMISNSFLSNLNNNLSRMDKYQTQLATNKRITKLSDDPIGILQSMRARVKLYRINEYQRNVEDAQTWLKQSEASIKELNEVIKSAYENAVDMANDYKGPEDKAAAAELIGELRDHVLMIGNTKINDKYIYGGFNNSDAPFTLNAGKIYYNGLDLSDATNPALIAEGEQSTEYEIGFGLKANISMPGTKLMSTGNDNIYAVMDGLYKLLKNNASGDEISKQIQKLQDAQSNVLSLQSEIGGQTNRLDLVANRYEDDTLTYTQMKSDVEDADQAEVIMQYKMAEAVYMSALKVGSNIIQPTLMDYLK